MKGRGRAKQRGLSERGASHERRSRCRRRSTLAKGRTVAALSKLSDSCLCILRGMTTAVETSSHIHSAGRNCTQRLTSTSANVTTATKCRRDHRALRLWKSPQRHCFFACTTLRSPLTHHSITAHKNTYRPFPNMREQRHLPRYTMDSTTATCSSAG